MRIPTTITIKWFNHKTKLSFKPSNICTYTLINKPGSAEQYRTWHTQSTTLWQFSCKCVISLPHNGRHSHVQGFWVLYGNTIENLSYHMRETTVIAACVCGWLVWVESILHIAQVVRQQLYLMFCGIIFIAHVHRLPEVTTGDHKMVVKHYKAVQRIVDI